MISLSLPRLPAVVTSIILLAQPVLAVLFAMILLSEAPSAGQLIGVTLVIGGIALATVPLNRMRRRALPATWPGAIGTNDAVGGGRAALRRSTDGAPC